MRPLSLPALLLLASCGVAPVANDPCAVAISDGVDLTVPADIATTTLECRPAGGASACDASISVARATCSDGFAFALSSAATTLLLRFASDGSQWSGGAELVGGPVLAGTVALKPIGDPATPFPPPGRTHQASFFLHGAGGTWNGTLVTTW